MDLMHSMQSRFSFKAFGLGLVGVAVVYAGLFGIAFIRSETTFESLQARLASQTVLVDRSAQAEAVETVDHLDTHDLVEAPAAVDEHSHASSRQEETLEDVLGSPSKALGDAPIDGFYEDSEYGRLPIAKSEFETPFSVYRKPFLLNQGRPFIAVAVEQFGLSKALSEELLSTLPGAVSFILSPYSQNPENWAQAARHDGHEVWLQLPVENLNFPMEDPGAKGLLTRVSIQYNQERLQWLLGRATGYAGVAAYTDSALENAGSMFNNIARDIFKRGLGFLELNSNEDSFFAPILEEEHVPRTATQQFIDIVDPQRPEVASVLEDIETLGGAVVVVRPSPRNIPALKRWLESLQKRGIEIVPVSAVAQANKE